jgi:hypothetical protein
MRRPARPLARDTKRKRVEESRAGPAYAACSPFAARIDLATSPLPAAPDVDDG